MATPPRRDGPRVAASCRAGWREPGEVSRFFYDVYGSRIESALPVPRSCDRRRTPRMCRYAAAMFPCSSGRRRRQGDLRGDTGPPTSASGRRRSATSSFSGDKIVLDHAASEEDRVRIYLLGAAFDPLHQRGSSRAARQRHRDGTRSGDLRRPLTEAASPRLPGRSDARLRALTDDICAIRLPRARPVVSPGYPQMKLWADTAGLLEERTESLEKGARGSRQVHRADPG